MDDWTWPITLLGVGVTGLILVDVFLTVFHIDTDGPLAWRIFQGVWRAFMVLVRAVPSARRPLVALAGPSMIVIAIAIWMGVFILGFSLVYWPHLAHLRAAEGLGALGFLDALYLSGGTATVLGYGDISPVHGGLQVVAFVQAGLGFGMMTAIITYLINVVSGVTERHAVSLRLWLATGGSGDGAAAVVRGLAREGSGDLRLRLQTLLPAMQSLHQKMHQFPILDLFYRSKNPAFAPEVMLKSAAEMAVAARLLAEDPRHEQLELAADELGETVTEIMRLIAAQHLPEEVSERLERPREDPADHELVDRIRASLRRAVPRVRLGEGEPPETVAMTVRRTRIFLECVDRLTGWRMDHALR